MVCPPPLAASLAIHHRVGKTGNMSTGHPGLGMHNDAGIDTHHVIALVNYSSPPGIFDVTLQLHSQWSVIPATPQPSIYLAAGEDKTTPLTQRDNLLHIYLVFSLRQI
jgi:hypothetical protein